MEDNRAMAHVINLTTSEYCNRDSVISFLLTDYPRLHAGEKSVCSSRGRARDLPKTGRNESNCCHTYKYVQAS